MSCLFSFRPVSSSSSFSPADLSSWNFPVTVRNEDSLAHALQVLSNPGRPFKPHRAVILNEDGDVAGILSQSDVVAWLREHVDFLEHTVPELVRARLHTLWFCCTVA